MKDYSELKIAAEQATQGLRVVKREWSDDDFEYQQEIFTVWSECETLEINIDGSFVGKDKADAEFIAAANPAAVLELIAEVESLKKDAARYRWLRKEAVMFHMSCEGSNDKDAYLSVTGWGDDDSSEIIDNAVDFEMEKQ